MKKENQVRTAIEKHVGKAGADRIINRLKEVADKKKPSEQEIEDALAEEITAIVLESKEVKALPAIAAAGPAVGAGVRAGIKPGIEIGKTGVGTGLGVKVAT